MFRSCPRCGAAFYSAAGLQPGEACLRCGHRLRPEDAGLSLRGERERPPARADNGTGDAVTAAAEALRSLAGRPRPAPMPWRGRR